jgi:hypothetical protein
VDWLVETSVSEKRAGFIFRAEVVVSWGLHRTAGGEILKEKAGRS